MSETLSKILYVEDEPDIQAVARIALESVGGLTVEVCSSGDEALEKVSAFNPDLVLLDVMMPNMDGPSTMMAIREIPEFSATPVVFMTAKVQPQEVQALLALGALDVIAKPFDPMTLSDQVKGIWATRAS
ncbi:MAG: response regulator [Rhodospirillaceae bacterium]|jgi:two-component system, OmpR family, response regulator|nr:response regulator [Rhodospirillaceae bacterium]MBT5658583.1 response regulator [Rhodospirillaceae bacterium]MBT5753221.1 response regulator [Rhodospirillaceae bacterium]